MKRMKIIGLTALLTVLITRTLTAQVGKPFIHDPSTIMECDGKYYTFGTGGGGLISNDGWTWNGGGVRPGGGAAPDAIKIDDRYLVIYGATGGASNHKGIIYTMWNKTLDPNSPDFKYTDPILVATSDGYEECDAIDPGVMLDPVTGRLWLSYGTYFGFTRIVELDPKTGKRVEGNKPVDVAITCEASDLIYRDGWYYLLATHGTCCDGANSTYNIVVGRSKTVSGPYLDNVGRSMLEGGGKMVVATEGSLIGPGHFGRMVLGDGIEKMSCHYEADLNQGGRSVLGIRPLLWKNGWPVAGENFKEGTYKIESERRGYGLE
ncbi:MAG: arabinan endo-1,5-alpha-L-arabinosidase, partial [Ferruginibacter sp.]